MCARTAATIAAGKRARWKRNRNASGFRVHGSGFTGLVRLPVPVGVGSVSLNETQTGLEKDPDPDLVLETGGVAGALWSGCGWLGETLWALISLYVSGAARPFWRRLMV